MKNRQQRRHPTHPSLPIQQPSKKRVVDVEKKKTSSAKGVIRRNGKRKNG